VEGDPDGSTDTVGITEELELDVALTVASGDTEARVEGVCVAQADTVGVGEAVDERDPVAVRDTVGEIVAFAVAVVERELVAVAVRTVG
jgi:hypothetical protein